MLPMTTLFPLLAVFASLLWLAVRLHGVLAAMRRLPDVAPDLRGRELRPWPEAECPEV